MLNNVRHQDGVTLLELLVTITILSSLLVLTGSILLSGMKASNQAQQTTLLQQEANYILSLLTTQHETQEEYIISSEENWDESSIIISNLEESFTISNPNFTYALTIDDRPVRSEISVFPESQSLPIKLVIKSRRNPDLEFKVQTIISRL